ncbi:hypothetical protein ACFW2V_13150 [Streptomyces sp. NPDC058947]|uniref:hypothetical protein n=1 Tax=Streptomyces sp. NPDC058947 TaxID=3346675 RepID=UPI0036B0D594
MAVLTVRELRDLLESISRDLPAGLRMVYDGVHLTLTDPAHPHTPLVRAEVDGIKAAVWDLTAFSASLDTVRAWLRMQQDDTQRVGISPFWGGGDHRVVFTGCGAQLAFPVIDLPSAPQR